MGYYGNRYSNTRHEISLFLFARYNVTPPNLKKNDGLSKLFSVRHGLICRHIRLFIVRHNEVCGELLYLAQRDLSPIFSRGYPIINQDRSISEDDIRHGWGFSETLGGIIIRVLWGSHTYAIIDVRLGDSDSDTYKKYPMKRPLYWWGK